MFFGLIFGLFLGMFFGLFVGLLFGLFVLVNRCTGILHFSPMFQLVIGRWLNTTGPASKGNFVNLMEKVNTRGNQPPW